MALPTVYDGTSDKLLCMIPFFPQVGWLLPTF